MSLDKQVAHFDYMITVTEEAGRFTARVTRDGAMIEHDGRASQTWAAPSCVSPDRAILVAKNAIDNDKIR